MSRLIYSILFLLILSNSMFSQEEIEEIALKERLANEQMLEVRVNENTLNYDIKYHQFHWNVDPAEYYISGSVRTDFVPNESMNEIYFDLSQSMTVDSVVFNGTLISYSQADEMVQITFPFNLDEGGFYHVETYYHGAPPSGGFGSFASETHNGVPVLWTLSEPYGARDWWPCKQDLNDKIDSIDVYVTVPEGNKVGSNGKLKETSVVGNEITYHWRHVYPIPAYLIAIAVTNYEEYSDWVTLSDGTELEILNYVYPESMASATAGTPATVGVLQYYDSHFGLYPYKDEKYGHAQFGWGGGMEHATMSFMANFNYGLIAHELAHQWFGDKITCGSWQDIWLNEGFATYLTALSYENIGSPEWNNWKVSSIGSVISQPGGSVLVVDTTSVSQIFSGRLSYRKGGLLLHMLRWEMEDDAFFQAMEEYATDEELIYNYARTSDLQAHMEATSGLDLDEYFADWFVGQGYPTHQIEYYIDGNTLYLKVNQTQSHPSVDFFELTLPILVQGASEEEMLRLDLDYDGQEYSVDLPFAPESISYDPEHWILSDQSTITINEALSVSELSDEGFAVYPNPVTDFVHVRTKSTMDYHIMVYDISGKLVQDHEVGKRNEYDLGVEMLSIGNYTLTISDEGKVVYNTTFTKR